MSRTTKLNRKKGRNDFFLKLTSTLVSSMLKTLDGSFNAASNSGLEDINSSVSLCHDLRSETVKTCLPEIIIKLFSAKQYFFYIYKFSEVLLKLKLFLSTGLLTNSMFGTCPFSS